MFDDLRKSKSLLAFGSVMEVNPTSDYREYMPKEKRSACLGKYWQGADRYLAVAMERHKNDRATTTE